MGEFLVLSKGNQILLLYQDHISISLPMKFCGVFEDNFILMHSKQIALIVNNVPRFNGCLFSVEIF